MKISGIDVGAACPPCGKKLDRRGFPRPLAQGTYSAVKGRGSPALTLYSLILCLFCSCTPTTPHQGNRVCFDGDKVCYAVEVVSQPAEMQRGLQFRTTLAKEAGMLFVFNDSGAHSFWMKNTLIPLDMIWMDAAQRVVFIASDVSPCKADPCAFYAPPAGQAALYVLEVNAGETDARGIDVGEKARFDF